VSRDAQEHTDLIFGNAILLKDSEGVNDFINAVRVDLKLQAEKAAEAIREKQARKAGHRASQEASDLRVDNLVRHGDLVHSRKRIRS